MSGTLLTSGVDTSGVLTAAGLVAGGKALAILLESAGLPGSLRASVSI